MNNPYFPIPIIPNGTTIQILDGRIAEAILICNIAGILKRFQLLLRKGIKPLTFLLILHLMVTKVNRNCILVLKHLMRNKVLCNTLIELMEVVKFDLLYIS